MAYVVYPDFSGGGSGGGGGPITYPLNGPAGSGSAPTFSVGGQGGLFSPSSGGIALASGGLAALIIDASQNVSLAANLAVAGATTLQALQAAATSVASLTSAGNIGAAKNLGVGGDASITGNLSAMAITATAALTAGSLSSQGGITGQSLTITGNTELGGSLDVKGTFSVTALSTSGPFYFPASGANAPGLALADDHGTGVYAGPNHVLGFSTNGQGAAYFDASQALVLAGNLTAPSASVQNSLTAGSLNAPTATLGALVVSGSTSLSGPATLSNDLTVQGTTRLANLVINTLSTQNNLSVGGTLLVSGASTLQSDLSVTGNTSTSGALSAGTTLNVAGASVLQGLNAAATVLGDLRLVLPQGSSRPAVASAPQPGNTTINYSAILDTLGNLSISSDFRGLGAASISGAITAASATLQTSLTANSASLAGSLSALTAVVGGATISSCQGNPTGQVSGSVGDVAVDRANGALYLKTSGQSTNTGWVVVTLSSTSVHYPMLAPDDSSGTAPAYSFASDSMRGLGYKPGAGLFLATDANGAPAVLMADNNASVTISPPLTASAALTVKGNTSLAALSASGAVQLASSLNVAGTTTLVGPTTAQALSLQGALSGGAATLTEVAVTDLNASNAVTAVAGISSQAYLLAPQVQIGATPAVISAGTPAPNGSVSGSPGDFYLEDGAGSAWIKVTGSATTSGWAQVSTSATGTAFPLTAPDGSLASPSYGFLQGSLGLTATGSGALSAITGGAIGWTLRSDKTLALAGALTVAAAASFAAGATVTGDLSASGQGTFSALSASTGQFSGALSAASLSTTGDATIGGAAHVTGALTSASLVASGTVAGSRLTSGGSNWFAGAGVPASNSGTFGDIASDQTSTDPSPFYVRTASGWQAVALAGAPAPTSFPLLAPSDSATAPSYSWAASPKTGAYSPGTNRYALATNGVSALSIDANQNVSLTAALSAQAATFASANVSGTITSGGNAQFGGTLQVTGQSTLSGAVSSGALTSSGAVSGTAITASGLLSGNTLQITSNASIGGNLTVTGTTTFNGVQSAPYYQASDGTQASPSYAFTSESTTGIWRPGTGQMAFAAGNASLLALTASKATFPATVAAAVVDSPTVRASGGTLSLQGGTTTVVSLTSSAITNAVPTYIPAGSVSSPSLVIGAAGGLSSLQDTRNGFTSYVSLTNPSGVAVQLTSYQEQTTLYNVYGLQFAGVGLISSRPNPNGFTQGQPGQLYQKNVGGASSSLWVYEGTSAGNTGWAAVLTTSSTITPTYPAVGPAGTAAAATFAVGSGGTGIYGGTDALSRAFLGLTQGGTAVARFATFTNNSLPVYLMGLGDPTSTSAAGGVLASAQLPTTGAPMAYPGMVYQYLGGGAANSLWINESTTSTPSWVKVLTTSSPNPGVTYPLVGPAGTAAAATFAVGAAGTGLFAPSSAVGLSLAGTQVLGITSTLATLSGNLSIGNTNAGLTSSGTNLLALQTAGTTALSISAAGVSTFVFQAIHTAGTAAAPGVAVGGGTSGLYTLNDGFGQAVTAVSTAGVPVANFTAYTSGGANTFQFRLADPASTTVRGGIIASAQTPSGNVNGTGGQIYQYLNGGAAQSVWVNEGTSLNSSSWAKVLTTSSTITPTFPLAAGAGSVAAPPINYGNSGTGWYGGTDGNSTAVFGASLGGTSQAWFTTYTSGGTGKSITGLFFGNPKVTPSTSGIMVSSASPVNAAGGDPGNIYVYSQGGAGNTLFVYEGTSSGTSGWARILTDSAKQSYVRLLQTTAPTAVSGQALIYARTDGQVAVTTTANSIAATFKQELAATVFSSSQTLAVANNGVTAVATGATQYTLTLPATQTATDLTYNFHIEGAGGFKIQAPSGVTIYNGTSASSSGGSMTSTSPGSVIVLFNRAGSSLWLARSATGSWTAA